MKARRLFGLALLLVGFFWIVVLQVSIPAIAHTVEGQRRAAGGTITSKDMAEAIPAFVKPALMMLFGGLVFGWGATEKKSN